MFRLFKRKRDKSSVMYGVLQKMGNVVDGKQRKAAHFLNGKASRLSNRQLKIGLFLFCVMFGIWAGYVVYEALFQPVATVLIKPITIPDHALIQDQEESKGGVLTPNEIQYIRSFQHYLDSLNSTAAGKATYDSIVRHRPGLFDSLAFIQQFYNEQLKQREYGKKK